MKDWNMFWVFTPGIPKQVSRNELKLEPEAGITCIHCSIDTLKQISVNIILICPAYNLGNW